MASVNIIGIIESVKFIPNGGGCFVFLSEYRKGYRKSDGTRVEDKYLSWKVIYKQGLVNYINNHFSTGMVVEVKGEVLPYAIENGETVDGYSVIGQTMNIFSVPRLYQRQEARMQKDSQLNSSGEPDLEGYNAPDF
jgi:hypothetical protein